MGTLIKRKGSFPLLAKKTVDKFFNDFITKDFDWGDKKFSASVSQKPSVIVNETDKDINVELTTVEIKKDNYKVEIDNYLLVNSSQNEVRKKDNFIKKEFNYRSFCRLPTL